MDLSNYVLVGTFNLPEPTRTTAPANNLLGQEVSAITFNWDTGTFFIVGDGGTAIVEIDATGNLLSTMTLAQGSSPQGTTFYDPEGLTYVGGGRFVMAEERDRQAVEFTYVAGDTLERADTQTVALGTFAGNAGIEGLSYDASTGGFIVVNEANPLGVYETLIDFDNGTATNGSPTTLTPTNLFDPALLGLSDLADVYALSNVAAFQGTPSEDHLLVLSQEDGRVLEIDRDGNIISELIIPFDPANPLSVPAQQHEGMTVDAAGNLYIVSENGGGDFDHPQVRVYSLASFINAAPTAVNLYNAATSIEENTNTTGRIKVADVLATDDGIGVNRYGVSGADAAYFEADNTGLYIKAGVVLDYETQSSYSVTVTVDDGSVGGAPDASTNYTLAVDNIVNEGGAPVLYISEVAPWSSGSSPVGADWFEITNSGSSAIDITGWRFDDGSFAFGNSVALNGITTIAPGESVIFIESATPATAITAFINTWFGGTAPAGLQIGSYTGSGLGLSTGGDGAIIFDAAGTEITRVSFGGSPLGPLFSTFDNAQGLQNATIGDLSAIGSHGTFVAPGDANEIGSPGSVGRLIISEVAPWSSGNSPVGADWFEVTNTTAFAIDITGWKMDDNSGSPTGAVALNGVTTIQPGESVIFIESANPAAARAAFIDTWFGGNAPEGLQIGTYTGSGVGLSGSGDAVNIYDAANNLRASVSFGASPTGPFATFDNAAGLNGVLLTTLSGTGTNGAHVADGDANEIGSPGAIVAVNDAPIGINDSDATALAEDGLSVAGGNVLTNDTDADFVQTATEVLSVTGARAGTEAAGGSLAAVSTATVIDGIYGQLTINADGTWSYALDSARPATQALNDGETASETFTYEVSDLAGSTDTAQLNLTIAGATEIVNGHSYAETLNGSAYGDTLLGFGGDDTINGFDGDDVLDGGAGADTLHGGMGDDIYHVVSAIDVVVEGEDEGIDLVISRGGLILSANVENGTLLGTRNTSLAGQDLDNVLTGNDGDNLINGFAGDDIIVSGFGNDRIIGGLGQDDMTGGAGADLFQFRATSETGLGSAADFITDFEQGLDLIGLNAIDANVSRANNQAFRFIGDAAFSNAAGELRSYVDAGNTWIEGDVDADGAADFAIRLGGAHTLTAADFVL